MLSEKNRVHIQRGDYWPMPKNGDLFVFDEPPYLGGFRMGLLAEQNEQRIYATYMELLPISSSPSEVERILCDEKSARDVLSKKVKPTKAFDWGSSPAVWASTSCWFDSGWLLHFDPPIRWAAETVKSSLTRVELKRLNDSPLSTHCAACAKPLQTWDSGWSIGKYCPICEG